MRIWPGTPYPLGATWDGEGMNFALFSEHATGVELCLFDAPDDGEPSRVDRPARAHGPDLARVPAGRAAGAAVRLPRPRPVRARARATASTATSCSSTRTPRRSRGDVRWDDARLRLHGRPPATRTSSFDERDSAARSCRSAWSIDEAFTWGDDRPPRVPWNRTVIYECHVTRHDDAASRPCPEELRGTYLGMASDPVIEHLLSLGVTAVELMPVHHFVARPRPAGAGADELLGLQLDRPSSRPTSALRDGAARGQQVSEFKTMVKTLHAAGHRGDPRRGLQPHRRGQPPRPHAVAARRRQRGLLPARCQDDQRYYMDFTGTRQQPRTCCTRARSS